MEPAPTGVTTQPAPDVARRAEDGARFARARRALRSGALARLLAAAPLACFALMLGWVFVSRLGRGLWEDGYFVKRFAYNYWHHGSFSWNVVDGPVYGMTLQALQLLGAGLYALAPQHVFTTLKAASCAALFGALPAIQGVVPAAFQGSEPRCGEAPPAPREVDVAATVGMVALSAAIVIEAALTGLETAFGLLMVALALRALFRPLRGARDVLAIATSVVAVYLTRPDAVWLPSFLLAARWLLALAGTRRGSASGAAAELRALTLAGVSIAAALGAALFMFQRYYGSALPLPFYVKTHGLNAQDTRHVAEFAQEKLKNVVHFGFFAAPLAFIACHARSRAVWLLLASSASFVAYHYFATIETMGYHSRFYLPALVPLSLAARLGYHAFLRRRSWLVCLIVYAGYVGLFVWLKHVDNTHPVPLKVRAAMYVPALVATGWLLLWPRRFQRLGALAVCLSLGIGALLDFPLGEPRLETDEAILLRQARPRTAFPGIERLRRLDPEIIYHTDMGAPGVLFPEAKVVDLDGLLNEAITLRRARFDDLCAADRPEAIYLPNPTYSELRSQMLASRCFDDYLAVTPPDYVRLYVRRDLAATYLALVYQGI